MPRGDKTGPMGAGAQSGRGAGFCAGFNLPGCTNFAPARGYGTAMTPGRGGGRGGRRCRPAGTRGFGNRPLVGQVPDRFAFGGTAGPQATTPQMEQEALRTRATALQAELEAINKRLGEMNQE